jgi:hypothetical protein
VRKDSCDYEGYKGNLKGNLDVDGITEHSTGYHWLICQENKGVVVHTQVSYALSQHNGTLQLSEDDSTPKWLNHFACNDIYDEAAKRSAKRNYNTSIHAYM